MSVLLLLLVCAALLAGYPVALTLAGASLLMAGIGLLTGTFDASFLHALPSRLFGTMNNQTLLAVPLFILMGVMLEKSRVAENLLAAMARLFGRLPGGLAIAVTMVGMLMAASTGIVGATVVTMGLLALPSMLRHGYDPRIATGTICATGTLGQIIPPSVALVLLGDVLSSSYQQAQLAQGVFAPKTVSVGDLFVGAIIPGLLLVALYVLWLLFVAMRSPERMPPAKDEGADAPPLGPLLLRGLLPPLALMVAVLGSILGGYATPTEAAAVGALGATLLALAQRALDLATLQEIMRSTLRITAMVFLILIGASVFSLVFRGFGGDDMVQELFSDFPGGVIGATLMVMLVMFLLGFILDFIEIIFVVVPIVAPVLLAMGLDPVWLGVMIAVNLQTSFLTPPFGFALFYLRGVTPPEIPTSAIYRGVMPFIVLQLLVLLALALFPALATWLPATLYGE